MPDTFQTLAELAVINDQNARDLGVSDIFNDAPVLRALAATVASNGTTHKYIKEAGAPTVGFRAVNAGRDNSVSDDELVSVDLKILDASFAVDKALADAYTKGGPEAYIAREARRHLRAAFAKFESQVLYGADSDGFDGIVDALDVIADQMVITAGGTTQSTGSSVFAIRTNADETDCMAVLGQSGQIAIDETVVQRVTGSNSKVLPMYFTPITGWTGLQIGGSKSVARLANLTEDSGKGLTDARLAELLSLFPAGRLPNFFAMSRRSLFQLQSSRTATNATGAPSPIPTDAFGIPIIVSEQVLITETLALVS